MTTKITSTSARKMKPTKRLSQQSFNDDSWNSFDAFNGLEVVSHDDLGEHLIIGVIRKEILQYRRRSPALYELNINVNQLAKCKFAGQPTKMQKQMKIDILVADFGARSFPRQCRVYNPTDKIRSVHWITGQHLQIYDSKQWMPIPEFLEKRFPAFDMAVFPSTMFNWWNDNGKTFAWEKLPTELAENIIKCCMHQSNVAFLPSKRCHFYISRRCVSRKPPIGPCEVFDQLSEWSGLLHVSSQVRNLALRLCLDGAHDLAFKQGLCIASPSIGRLSNSLRRLGKCYQMREPNGVPVDQMTQDQAHLYKWSPQIYPELNRYATFAHGIRSIHLNLDFYGGLHFFGVSIGGWHLYRPKHYPIDYNIFRQLPNLKELSMTLPSTAIGLIDRSDQSGPCMFYGEGLDCPRTLHRRIYERAAEVLAFLDNVHFDGFMEDSEQSQHEMLRDRYIALRKFTPEDLEELYADDEGGVKLEESVYPIVTWNSPPVYAETDPSFYIEQALHWPPKCRCPTRCLKFLAEFDGKRVSA